MHNPFTGQVNSTVQNVAINRNVQVLHLADGVTVDVPADTWSLTDPTKNTWADFKAPAFDGYKPSQDDVPEVIVDPNKTTNTTVDITYTPDSSYKLYSTNIEYIDEDNSNSIISTSSLTGRAGVTVPVTITIPKNYVQDTTKAVPTTYTFSTGTNSPVLVYLKHQVIQSTSEMGLARDFVPVKTSDGNIQSNWIPYAVENSAFDSQSGQAIVTYNEDLVTGTKTATSVEWAPTTITSLDPSQVAQDARNINIPGYEPYPAWVSNYIKRYQRYQDSPDAIVYNVFGAWTKQQVIDALNRGYAGLTFECPVVYVPYATSTETKSIIRHITLSNYPDPNHTTDSQVVQFSRQVHVLSGTSSELKDSQETSWSYANPAITGWGEYTAPSATGYTAYPSSLAAQTVSPNDKDAYATIVYVNNNDLSHTVTRTIQVQLGNNSPITVGSQMATITRPGSLMANGSMSYGDWTTTTMPAYSAPSESGWTVTNPNAAASVAITPQTENSTVIFQYTRNMYHAIVEFVDDTDPSRDTSLASDSYSLTGSTGQTIATNIDTHIPTGYSLSPNQGVNYDNYKQNWTVGNSDVTIRVHLIHKESTVGTETKTRTAYRINEDTDHPSLKHKDWVQTVTLKHQYDEVTGQYSWTQGNWEAEDAPQPDEGFTLDLSRGAGASAPQMVVTHSTPANVEVDFYYHSKTTSLPVEFVDDTTGTSLSNLNYTVTLMTDKTVTIGYASHVPSGYSIVNASSLNNTYDWNGYDPVSPMIVHLTHSGSTSTSTSLFTRTIQIQYNGSTSTYRVQSANLTETVTRDAVTGNVTGTQWSSGTFGEVDAPTITGYTLTSDSPTTAPEETIGGTEDTPDKPADVIFKYDVNRYHVTVNYENTDDNDTIVKTDTVNGTWNQTVPYTAQAPTNYILNVGQPTSYNFTLTGNQVYTIYVHDGTKSSTSTSEFTRDIYVSLNGSTALYIEQAVTLTKTDTINAVTGDTIGTQWSSGTLAEVDAPSEPGYKLISGSPTTAPLVTIGGGSTTPTNPADVTFIYEPTAASESVNVNYVDDTEGGVAVTGTALGNGVITSLAGVVGQTVTKTIVVPTNYALADNQPSTISITFAKSGNKDITVHLVHSYSYGVQNNYLGRDFVPYLAVEANPDMNSIEVYPKSTSGSLVYSESYGVQEGTVAMYFKYDEVTKSTVVTSMAWVGSNSMKSRSLNVIYSGPAFPGYEVEPGYDQQLSMFQSEYPNDFDMNVFGDVDLKQAVTWVNEQGKMNPQMHDQPFILEKYIPYIPVNDIYQRAITASPTRTIVVTPPNGNVYRVTQSTHFTGTEYYYFDKDNNENTYMGATSYTPTSEQWPAFTIPTIDGYEPLVDGKTTTETSIPANTNVTPATVNTEVDITYRKIVEDRTSKVTITRYYAPYKTNNGVVPRNVDSNNPNGVLDAKWGTQSCVAEVHYQYNDKTSQISLSSITWDNAFTTVSGSQVIAGSTSVAGYAVAPNAAQALENDNNIDGIGDNYLSPLDANALMQYLESQNYNPAAGYDPDTMPHPNTNMTIIGWVPYEPISAKLDTKAVTRTITVHDPASMSNGQMVFPTATVTQTASLQRSEWDYTSDNSLYSYGDWNSMVLDSYNAPNIDGYTPSPSTVDSELVNGSTSNNTVDIYYTPKSYTDTVNFLMSGTNTSLNTPVTVTTAYKAVIDQSGINSVINSLSTAGYTLVGTNPLTTGMTQPLGNKNYDLTFKRSVGVTYVKVARDIVPYQTKDGTIPTADNYNWDADPNFLGKSAWALQSAVVKVYYTSTSLSNANSISISYSITSLEWANSRLSARDAATTLAAGPKVPGYEMDPDEASIMTKAYNEAAQGSDHLDAWEKDEFADVPNDELIAYINWWKLDGTAHTIDSPQDLRIFHTIIPFRKVYHLTFRVVDADNNNQVIWSNSYKVLAGNTVVRGGLKGPNTPNEELTSLDQSNKYSVPSTSEVLSDWPLIIDDVTDKTPLTYTLTVHHLTQATTGTQTNTFTVNNQGAGDATPKAYTESVLLKRTGSKDLVTGSTSWGDWTSTEGFTSVVTSQVAGYGTSYGNQIVDPTKTITITAPKVDPTKLSQSVTVTYIPVSSRVESRTPTRTIWVDNPDGTKNSNFQAAFVKRSEYYYSYKNSISIYSYGSWNSNTWPSSTVPSFDGYTPSPATIDSVTVTWSTSNTTLEIKYTANSYTDTVNFLTSDTSTSLNPSIQVTATYKQAINQYQISSVIDSLSTAGYTLVNNPTAGITQPVGDQSYNVIFKPNAQNTTVTYVDDDDNYKMVHVSLLTGVTNQTIDTNIAAPKNYDLVTGQDLPTKITFGANGYTPLTVHLKHHHSTSTSIDDYKIAYFPALFDGYNNDGSEQFSQVADKYTIQHADVPMTITFDQDDVTKSTTFKDLTVPTGVSAFDPSTLAKFDGYNHTEWDTRAATGDPLATDGTPSSRAVSREDLQNFLKTYYQKNGYTFGGKTYEVWYMPNPYTDTVNFVTSGANSTALHTPITLNTYYKGPINQSSVNSVIDSLKAAGYTLFKNPLTAGMTQPVGNQSYDVIFEEGTQTVQDTENALFTVKYTGAGTNTPESQSETVKLTRSGLKNLVTGNTSWGNWTSTSGFTSVVTPLVVGYDTTYNGQTVDPSKTITISPKVDLNKLNQTVTVTYSPHEYTDIIQFLDSDTSTTLYPVISFKASYGQTINFDDLPNSDAESEFVYAGDSMDVSETYSLYKWPLPNYDSITTQTAKDQTFNLVWTFLHSTTINYFDVDTIVDGKPSLLENTSPNVIIGINHQTVPTEIEDYLSYDYPGYDIVPGQNLPKTITFTQTGYPDIKVLVKHHHEKVTQKVTFTRTYIPYVNNRRIDSDSVSQKPVGITITFDKDDVTGKQTYRSFSLDNKQDGIPAFDPSTLPTYEGYNHSEWDSSAAKQDPLGDVASIQAISHDALETYLKNWYQTHNENPLFGVNAPVEYLPNIYHDTVNFLTSDANSTSTLHSPITITGTYGYELDGKANSDIPDFNNAVSVINSLKAAGYTLVTNPLTAGMKQLLGDQTYNVYFTLASAPQSMTIQYVDDDENSKTVSSSLLTGMTNQSVDTNITAPTGYELVPNQSLPKTITLKANDKDVLKVHLKHKQSLTQTKGTVTFIVEYTGAGSKNPSNHTESVAVSRTGTEDLVTKQTKWGSWSMAKQKFSDVVTPLIAGYATSYNGQISDPTQAITITGPTVDPTKPKQVVKVTYVQYKLDKVTDIRTINVTNPNGIVTRINQKAEITRPEYYYSDSNSYSYGEWSKGGFASYTPPTITGYTASPSLVDSEIVTSNTPRNTTVDVSYTKNDSDSTSTSDGSNSGSEQPTTPEMPSQANASIKSESDSNAKPLPMRETAQMLIALYDEDENQNVGSYSISAKAGTKNVATNITSAQVTKVTGKNGYQIDGTYPVAEDFTYTGAKPNFPSSLTVKLKHGKKMVTDRALANFNVQYSGVKNSLSTNGQSVEYTRQTTQDEVTSSMSYGKWTTDGSFQDVKVPVENGYVANVSSVKAPTIDLSKLDPKAPLNVTQTVRYSAVGHIIPVDEQGKQLKNVTHPAYQNDPNDPTKVKANEAVPTITHYTPAKTTVSPTSPTQDTNVPYDSDARTLTIRYVDDDENGKQYSLSTINGYYAGDTVKTGIVTPTHYFLVNANEPKSYVLTRSWNQELTVDLKHQISSTSTSNWYWEKITNLVVKPNPFTGSSMSIDVRSNNNRVGSTSLPSDQLGTFHAIKASVMILTDQVTGQSTIGSTSNLMAVGTGSINVYQVPGYTTSIKIDGVSAKNNSVIPAFTLDKTIIASKDQTRYVTVTYTPIQPRKTTIKFVDYFTSQEISRQAPITITTLPGSQVDLKDTNIQTILGTINTNQGDQLGYVIEANPISNYVKAKNPAKLIQPNRDVTYTIVVAQMVHSTVTSYANQTINVYDPSGKLAKTSSSSIKFQVKGLVDSATGKIIDTEGNKWVPVGNNVVSEFTFQNKWPGYHPDQYGNADGAVDIAANTYDKTGYGFAPGGLGNHVINIHYVPVSEQVTVQYETVGNGSWSLVHTDNSLSGVFNGSTALNITAPSGYKVIGMLDEKGNFSSTVPSVFHFTDPGSKGTGTNTIVRAVVVPTTPIKFNIYFRRFSGGKFTTDTKGTPVSGLYGSKITVPVPSGWKFVGNNNQITVNYTTLLTENPTFTIEKI